MNGFQIGAQRLVVQHKSDRAIQMPFAMKQSSSVTDHAKMPKQKIPPKSTEKNRTRPSKLQKVQQITSAKNASLNTGQPCAKKMQGIPYYRRYQSRQYGFYGVQICLCVICLKSKKLQNGMAREFELINFCAVGYKKCIAEERISPAWVVIAGRQSAYPSVS